MTLPLLAPTLPTTGFGFLIIGFYSGYITYFI